jgi:hypothetical protein
MRYLIIFENFDEYYKEVPFGYLDNRYEDYEEADTFSQSEITQISNALDEIGFKLDRHVSDRLVIYLPSKLNKLFIVSNIIKLIDGWYLINYTGNAPFRTINIPRMSFKCDQLDGLIKNIKDILENTIIYKK